jgi:Selenocysteine lyase
VIAAWKQREQRDGIKPVWVNLQMPSEDNNYLANAYIRAFTPKTKVVSITHMINWNGQILPVKTIADAAHQRNIEVVVDGAPKPGPVQIHHSRAGSRLFWRQPAQMAGGAHLYGAAIC